MKTNLLHITRFQLGRHKARCVAVSLLMPPVEVGSRAGAPAVGGGFPVPLFRLWHGFTIR